MKTLRNFIIAILGLACLCACSRQPSRTADIPYMLPSGIKIAVAPFTQPRDPYQLISGQIPENQGHIDQNELLALDQALKNALLQDTNRSYDFIARHRLPPSWSEVRSSGQPMALKRWLEYGREQGAKYLLVPQVLDWHEREGSEAGVANSAHVRVEFFLLNIDREGVQGRSIFEEKQVGLADNLLAIGDFFKRKGQWISAGDLALEGMKKAIRELGL